MNFRDRRQASLMFFATLLVSAAAIAYEILLMRVLSIVQWHHFAYMIISLALLGYGASGTAIALGRRLLEPHFEAAFAVGALLLSVSMVACFIAGQLVPFNALEIVWNPRQFLYLSLIYLVYFVPFFFAAMCVGLALSCRRALISRIYFFDLFGAGLGAMLVIAALFLLAPQKALVLLAMLALAASVMMACTATLRAPLFAAQAAVALVLLVGLPQAWMSLHMSPYKSLSQALQVIDSRALKTVSSPLGLVTVVESPRIPFRHAPGLSISTRHAVPEQLAVFIDGDGMSAITRYDGDPQTLAYLGDTTAALPYALLDDPRVLILGAGTGADVLMALHFGAGRIDAVELDPRVADLVRDTYADFAGRIYDDARVTLHIGEARGFVAANDGRYDLIQVALLDSFSASGSGVQALNESYVYTVEAIGEYLEHTAAGGMLAITRWLKLPPRDNLKLAAIVIEALRRSGIAEPGQRIAAIRSWNTVTLLVKNGAFSGDEIARLREFARARSFDTAYYPGMTAADGNRFNILAEPFLFDGVTALLSDRAGDFIARYKFHIAPATDNQPYFFHFFKWSTLPEVMALRKRGGAGLIEWGYLILTATVVQAAIAGAILILLPLFKAERHWPRGTVARMGPYFFALGLAFLFVEIAFIQKFILFLSHPLYAVAVVLGGFLVFAGVGSAYSDKLRRRAAETGPSPVRVAVAGIVFFSLAYVTLLPQLFELLIGLPGAIKIGLSIVLIAPLAFCMGMPFPLGLSRLADNAPDFIPWAWGINGFASVLSAALATLLAIEFGFTWVVLLALALYAGAAALIGNES